MASVIHRLDRPQVILRIQRFGFECRYHFHTLSACRTYIGMLIDLDLNTNDSESLLRHCAEFQPASGDCGEDSRLADALSALALAIKDCMNAERSTVESIEVIDPELLGAAINLLENKALAIGWLARPMRALGGKRPLEVDIEEVLALTARLEHGIVA